MPPKAKKIARQTALPGMENNKIAAIENAALDYAEIRDERQQLTTKEVECKTKLIGLMHKSGKTEYERGKISIKLTVEKEKITVRVRDEDKVQKPKQTDFDPNKPPIAKPDPANGSELATA